MGIGSLAREEFNGDFSPKTLSKKKPTPIAFWISGRLKTLSGEHIAPMREFVLEGDRNAASASKAEAEIEFPEQLPINVKSELLAFNGGFKGGVTTFYLHAYITVPTPAAIITVVKVRRINKGRFGLHSIATIPKIAGGSGSVTFFKLSLKKGILSAKCPDGHLDARGTALFGTTPPTKLNGAVVRPCTGR